MPNKATINYLEDGTNRKVELTANGSTSAVAQAVGSARTALTVGTLVSAKVSSDFTVPPTMHASTQFSDAVLVVKKGTAFKSIQLQNISVNYAKAAPNPRGEINLGNADIAAFVGLWEDSSGLSGYTPYSGRFVR